MTTKPLPWLRIEAADEARCDTLARFAVVEPEWKIAKKEMNDAEEALLDGQTAARERFIDTCYDMATSESLNRLTADFEQKQARFRKLDSRKRSLADEIKKLTENELKMISDAREPGIFDGGDKLGPDGWKKVRLRDITPGPDPEKDLEKQVWTAAGLEENGYHNIGEYLQGRGRLIPALVDDGEIGANTLEEIDVAVYRYLERRKLLDKWPKGIDAPSGEQMTILQSSDENADPEDELPAYDGEKQVDEPAEESGEQPADGPPFAVRLPSAKFWYADATHAESCSMRSVKLCAPWSKVAETMGAEMPDLSEGEEQALEKVIGKTPYEACARLIELSMHKGDLPDPVDPDHLDHLLGIWMGYTSELGEIRTVEGLPAVGMDEYTQFALTHIIEGGAENVRRFSAWSPTLGAMLTHHRDSEFYDPAWIEPKDNAQKNGKAKPAAKKKRSTKKKPRTKKKAVKG